MNGVFCGVSGKSTFINVEGDDGVIDDHQGLHVLRDLAHVLEAIPFFVGVAVIPVEPLFYYSLWVNVVNNGVGVRLLGNGEDRHCAELGDFPQELLQVRSLVHVDLRPAMLFLPSQNDAYIKFEVVAVSLLGLVNGGVDQSEVQVEHDVQLSPVGRLGRTRDEVVDRLLPMKHSPLELSK